ncbi:hypothetical protein ANN_08208 [Periplaneta americana]|uniref:Uncharacterized protein n=1 Tax=Periplaneta americana TaxID=6978 RepID=A0ABQ8T2B9_PERAM|nr:hypothetical protein ANN_08208 [Periplaneta americana]
MAGLCEGGNEPSGSLKAICNLCWSARVSTLRESLTTLIVVQCVLCDILDTLVASPPAIFLDVDSEASLSECYFAGKGAALVLPPNERLRPSSNNNSNSNSNRNGNVTSNGNGSNHNRRVSASGSDIQQHLQSMFYLLRPEETLKMASIVLCFFV